MRLKRTRVKCNLNSKRDPVHRTNLTHRNNSHREELNNVRWVRPENFYMYCFNYSYSELSNPRNRVNVFEMNLRDICCNQKFDENFHFIFKFMQLFCYQFIIIKRNFIT